MKILVTGSEGFVGSHFVEELLNNNYKVKAFVYYNSFNSIGWLKDIKKKNKNLEIYFGDIRDYNSVLNSLKNIDIIYNLAALISIPYSYRSPQSYIDVNTYGTLNLLNAAKEKKIKNFFQISTSEVYGTAKYIPIDEQHQLNAQSPYSASKIAADQLAYSYMCSFNIPVTILRPFNIFGPRQSLRAIIPTIINQVIHNNEKINLGNISSSRDFNYVKDTVQSMVSIANVETKKIIGKTFNIGSGYELSINNVLKRILSIANKNLKVVKEDKKLRPSKSEVDRLVCDNKNIKKVINYKNNFSGKNNIDKGLKLTFEWYKNNITKNEFITNFKNNYE
tara:strand:- start:1180 stop:2184 length:1005 start_codon:yes stop_codon:yes gene_type:complete